MLSGKLLTLLPSLWPAGIYLLKVNNRNTRGTIHKGCPHQGRGGGEGGQPNADRCGQGGGGLVK